MLDVGCGTGRDAAIFSQQGYQVTGIDFSEELLAIAKKTAPLVTFVVGDVRRLPFVGEALFDGIWANASLLHIEKAFIRSVLEKIHLLLRPEGAFFLSVKEGEGEVFSVDTRFGGEKARKFWHRSKPGNTFEKR